MAEAKIGAAQLCPSILFTMKAAIAGTAGHIDHGKTSLVKALTGIDADRLQEEKRRGITIDIGFAHLELRGGDGETLRIGFVDVPGHERFVRNMLAGIGGIDLVVLVIAANEGIKPQTREHFDICRLLGMRHGMTVLTKADAVDAETLEVVKLEVAEFLRGSFLDAASSPIVAVSCLTGAGIEDAKRALAKIAGDVAARDSYAIARLPVDRAFTMKGFGTVVTGTLVAGSIRKEDELEVFPAGKRVRVRGVQVHGMAVEAATAGQRTALNLAGISTEELARGMTLAPLEVFRSSARIDASVSLLGSAKALKDGARVHFHAYTAETIAEVRLYQGKQIRPGEEAFAQLRFAEPMLILPGDRFVMRQFSPVVTIGGGIVLDTAAPRKRRMADAIAFLGTMLKGSAEQVLTARVARAGVNGVTVHDLREQMNLQIEAIEKLAAKAGLMRCGAVVVSGENFEEAEKLIVEHVRRYQELNPLAGGMSKEELRDRAAMKAEVFFSALQKSLAERKLELTGDAVHLAGRRVVMKDEEAESKAMIEEAFHSAGLKVPALAEVLGGLKVDKARAQKIVTLLLREKVLVKVSDDFVFHQSALSTLRQRIAGLKPATSKIDVARFKDLAGVSRKYAIPLLEYLDRERVTRRVGDERVIL
ncbi:MAG: selenocysteine-specific translation elongation factor [Terriglobales bacterium]